MAYPDIDLRTLRAAVNSIFDHLMEDLGVERVTIDPAEDFYWECSVPAVHDSSTAPSLEAGRLTDDLEFTKRIRREESGAVSYNLIHIAPLLRYIGEKVKR